MKKRITINFAYKTFKWSSEAKEKAAVHCVIVGFSNTAWPEKQLYISDAIVHKAKNINAYLVEGPDVLISNRKQPLCSVPAISFGSMPNDNGLLSDYTDEQHDSIVRQYPQAKKMFKKFVGAIEFINNKSRWCLWLKDIPPYEIKSVPAVYDAVKKVQIIRNQSNREETRKLADVPTLFGEIRQPESDYLIIPRHSSASRKYIPIGYISADIICGDANMLISQADLYVFGVLVSNVHMSWVKTVCGRIKSDYRYSGTMVYNNFPWPSPTDEQKARIKQTAQEILDARAKYPDSSLADLYDPLTMPPELITAHQNNDRAIMRAYGFNYHKMTESDCISALMNLYQKQVTELKCKKN